jgi:hypothetical protein
MARCRAFSASDLQVPENVSGETVEIEPSVVLGELPSSFIPLQDELYVQLWDNNEVLTYRYGQFMSKTYALRNGFLHLGSIKMKINELSIMVGLRIFLVETDELTEPVD